MSYSIKKLLCAFTAAALIATLCCPLSFASQGTEKKRAPLRDTPADSPITAITPEATVAPEPEATPDVSGASSETHTRGDAANSADPTQEPIPSADPSESHTRGDAAEPVPSTQEPIPAAGSSETSTRGDAAGSSLPADPASEEKQSSIWMIIFVVLALVLSMISVAMSVVIFLIMKVKLTEAKQSANGLRDQLEQIKSDFDSIQSSSSPVSRSSAPSASRNSIQSVNNTANSTVQPASSTAFSGQTVNSMPSSTVHPANNAAFSGQTMNSVPSSTVHPANNAAFSGQTVNSMPSSTVHPANNAAFSGQTVNNMAENRGGNPFSQKKAEPEASRELTNLHLASRRNANNNQINLLHYSSGSDKENNNDLHLYSNGECHYVSTQKKNIKKLIGRGYLDLFNVVVGGSVVTEQDLSHYTFSAELKSATPAQLDPDKMIDGQPISVLTKGTLRFER